MTRNIGTSDAFDISFSCRMSWIPKDILFVQSKQVLSQRHDFKEFNRVY
jgi:hypothetical protein